ncbi:MAG: hypothetical protein KC646_17270 [Candidatus Cloacimonetes bacterium]|nr:hypothetical protein [Candidatus Cloacimonadota bacterium]
MKSIILRPYVLLLLFVFSQTALVPSSHAGMLGDVWGKIVGFFTGKKKGLAPEQEAQVKVMLENTQKTQDSVIQAINDVDALQSQIQDLKDPEMKKRVDEKMEAIVKAVEENNKSFEALSQVQQQLQQAEMLDKYQAQFEPFYKKQDSISQVLQKVQDKYNELSAFTADAEEEEQASQAPVDTTAVWENPEVRSLIDEYLTSHNLDEWGGPKVAGATISRPKLARGMDRYQYLMFASKGLKEFLEAKGFKEGAVEQSAPAPAPVEAPKASTDETNVDRVIVENIDQPAAAPKGPAAATTSISTAKPKVGMALTNRYDNAALREEKNKLYREMMTMTQQGKMESEEYVQLLQKYNKVSAQLKK